MRCTALRLPAPPAGHCRHDGGQGRQPALPRWVLSLLAEMPAEIMCALASRGKHVTVLQTVSVADCVASAPVSCAPPCHLCSCPPRPACRRDQPNADGRHGAEEACLPVPHQLRQGALAQWARPTFCMPRCRPSAAAGHERKHRLPLSLLCCPLSPTACGSCCALPSKCRRSQTWPSWR